MNRSTAYNFLPLFVALTGAIGLALRWWALSFTDEKGLLVTPGALVAALVIFSLAVPAALFFLTRDLRQAGKYSYNFPPSLFAAIGAALAGLGIGIHSMISFSGSQDAVDLLGSFFGGICAILLIFSGWLRHKGKQSHYAVHLIVAVYFMFQLICQYRRWSTDPQLLDYAYQLLATICLMLASYHRSSFDADQGQRSSYAFFALCAGFFCCLSLTNWEDGLLYLGAGIWMLADLCSLTPMTRKGLFEQEAG